MLCACGFFAWIALNPGATKPACWCLGHQHGSGTLWLTPVFNACAMWNLDGAFLQPLKGFDGLAKVRTCMAALEVGMAESRISCRFATVTSICAGSVGSNGNIGNESLWWRLIKMDQSADESPGFFMLVQNLESTHSCSIHSMPVTTAMTSYKLSLYITFYYYYFFLYLWLFSHKKMCRCGVLLHQNPYVPAAEWAPARGISI